MPILNGFISSEHTKSHYQDQVDMALETQDSSLWPGMTYEQGVINALEWVLGQREQPPMVDE